MPENNSCYKRRVIGGDIHAISWEQSLSAIYRWAKLKQSRYVCICNVHSVVTAQNDPNFAKIINSADIATPDGAPVAWYLRWYGNSSQQRISGPDLMWKYCQLYQNTDESIFLYGSTQETLNILKENLKDEFQNLKIAGSYSPPFRKLTEDEDKIVIDLINDSGAGVVWVSLGCPKQEIWMAEHKHKINAVMIGVGAAFDYHAKIIRRAPKWVQNIGFEWFYRLCSEPRRLWKRYLLTNSQFVYIVFKTILNEYKQYLKNKIL
jgi:N-acetylglucosaminyldiphosphoundecaprenol N-acetyl-beta-D-mannosaminyltransferase